MKKMNKKSKEGIKKKIASIGLAVLFLNVVMAGIFVPSGNVLRADNSIGLGDVIINELMWMGSSKNDRDQWIELKNVSDKILNLEGCQLRYKNNSGNEEELANLLDNELDNNVNPGEYYLVSHYTKSYSKINIVPDLGGTTDVDNFDLDNLQIKLYCGGDLIDTADDGLNGALAGEYITDSIWKSMSRKDIPGTGTSAGDWCTASTSVNWYAGTTEKGTPGAPNVCNYISGYKFNDLDNDGKWDKITNGDNIDEPGIDEWTIELYQNLLENPIDTAITLAGNLGYYEFKNLIAGTYFVQEVQTDWSQTFPASPSYHKITISEENPISENNNFGNHEESQEQTGSLTICKYEDLNGDGILDKGEPKVTDPLWEFYIDGSEYIADEDGCITIDDMSYGEYIVTEQTVDGWIQTGASSNGILKTDGSVTATVNELNLTINFLNRRTQCSDGINNNDGDELIDADDPGCWETFGDPESYNLNDDDEYNPYCGDGVCNNNETCSTCPQDCGACSTSSGGGGGWTPPTVIKITNEKVSYLGEGKALVSWDTNVTTTNQVVYGDDSKEENDLGNAPEYDYDSVNEESGSMYEEHEVMITCLTDGVTYYFRPVADRNGSDEVIGEEVSYVFEEIPEGGGEVKGETTETPPTECNYLLEYIKLGADNNPVEVEKLERFLNEFEGENLAVNGIYEQADFDAVSRFQEKYLGDILSPWSHNAATGYVYITTKKKINEIYCQTAFPLTAEQEAEVASFAERFLDIFTGSAEASDDSGEEDLTPGDTAESSTTEDEEDVSGRVGGVQDETEDKEDETTEEAGDEKTEDTTAEDKNKDTEEDIAVTEDDQKEDKVSGSEYTSYLLWVVAIIIIAGIAWYYWPKKKTDSE